MATFVRASDLAAHQRRRLENVRIGMEAAQREAALEAKNYAYQLVSGSLSSKELAALGHPFSKGSPGVEKSGPAKQRIPKRVANSLSAVGGSAVYVSLLPINVQSDALRQSLSLTWSHRQGVTTYRIGFTDPTAQYVLNPRGTRSMLARGFWDALNTFYAARADFRLRAALLAAHRA